jgi:hypothetical protein
MNADPLSNREVDEELELDDEDAEELETEASDDDPDTDNVGDPSVEINVEDLIRELEGETAADTICRRQHEAKRRLEDLMERKRSLRDLEDFDDYEL